MVKERRHYTIPVFIPGGACPFRCIFCDQNKITGIDNLPATEEIEKIIRQHLETIPQSNTEIEVGFFGGTFTGLTAHQQQQYLKIVLPFIDAGRVRSIRISTRPDFISEEKLELLKQYHVKTIELGAQSMDDEVLRLSSRGHLSETTERASAMITSAGFSLGLQMMIGLPGDSEEKTIQTARRIVALQASETRIYPVLVISGTELENMYLSGRYQPLTMEEAIRRTKLIIPVFECSNVRILRIGLHPSEDLRSGAALVAGPFHPSFRELVMTEIWHDRFLASTFSPHHTSITIHVNPSDHNNAIGYSGKNKKFLQSRFKQVKFISDLSIPERTFHADYR